MAIDEQTRQALDFVAKMNPLADEPSIAAFREMERHRPPAKPAPERALLAEVRDDGIDVDGRRIPIRIYTPKQADRFGERPPLVLYFHGGGHTVGVLDDWDGVCSLLASQSGMPLVSVDYRRAPENKFPAAPEDCYAALLWAVDSAASIGADPSRIVVAGDSAGGNLAAVVTLMAKDRQGPKISYQVLMYPGTNGREESASAVRNGEGYLLTRKMMDFFTAQYLRSDADRANPYFAPMKAADHSRLPPAMIITAEYDPLLDEGEGYSRKLLDAGVPVEYCLVNGTIHGFVTFYQMIDSGRRVLTQIAQSLRRHFQAE
jgi:acetyl esterase